ncbi:hypothetical protein Forpe1208_v016024 [Fusarium oxysporum f. sp. rapae]|uniref:HAT C-terminal dimerisation domain-containing protein n=1 Tax=Fusarium oxysporum f. sp. rapae TaxID=485398 RepID=A0A8J5NEK4_FUSOX|nr:hypothetical protein Forpe1208_v016024 [Fusarium oxysporum f. sp. rapae]
MDFLHHHFTRTKNRAFSGPRFYARFHVAWLKFEKYYQLTEQAPVYVAGILLHPALRKSYLSEQWRRNPAWVSNAVKAVRKIWSTEYKIYQLPDKQQEKGQELDEFDRWRQKVYSTASEVKDEFDRFIYGSQVGIGQQTALQWWLEPTQRENFPFLCRMAIDIFCIPPMSTEAERIFSGARRQVTWDRSSMSAKMVEAWVFREAEDIDAAFQFHSVAIQHCANRVTEAFAEARTDILTSVILILVMIVIQWRYPVSQDTIGDIYDIL